jgi:hypothetical protein
MRAAQHRCSARHRAFCGHTLCSLALATQEEKRVLEGLAQWFRGRAARLESLEYYHERRLKLLGLLDDDGNSTFEDMIQVNM